MINKQIIFPVTTKQFLIVIAIGFMGLTSLYNIFASSELTPKEICEQEYIKKVELISNINGDITKECIKDYSNSPHALASCLDSLSISPINTCSEKETGSGGIKELTLRDMFSLGSCRFINDKHKLPKYNLEWLAYDIACEKGKSFEVRSPGQYKLSYKGYGVNLGNYIILTRENSEIETNERIVLAHIVNDDEQNTVYNYYDVVGKTDVSGASTNYHVHIELWDGFYYADRNMLLTGSYQSWDGTRLLNHRGWDFGQPTEEPPVYYFTSYNLGDPKQNDSTPCIGASGKDLCYLERSGVRTMALTKDIREKLGISFGEKVLLKGDAGCEGTYQVEDEMNIRFRSVPGIKRPGTNYYIKGDLPSKQGGACSITKL